MFVASTYLVEDDHVQGAPHVDLIRRAQAQGLRCQTLHIQSLADGWETKPGRFKSGNGPLLALASARDALESDADVVLISGRDQLRTGYERDERASLMDIYDGVSIPEAYTRLTRAFFELHGWDLSSFRGLADALHQNYRRTAEARGLSVSERDNPKVTELLRRNDCANPNIDFVGEVVLANQTAVNTLGLDDSVQVTAVATASVDDGPAHVSQIAPYHHLRTVMDEVGLDRINPEDAVLELYTCFPIVPIAFCVNAGWSRDFQSTMSFFDNVEITVSGGMNLSRAPWNNPALRGLILTAERLRADGGVGVVHGNGGVGGLQGLAVLRAERGA